MGGVADKVTKVASNPIAMALITGGISGAFGYFGYQNFLAKSLMNKFSISAFTSSFIVGAGASLVMGAVGKKLMPKFDIPTISTSLEQGTTITGKSPIGSWRVIYGETRVGGNMIFAETTSDNTYLHMVNVLAGHEISDITSIYFNDDLLSLETLSNDSNGIPIYTPTSGDPYYGKATIKKHFGDPAQLADADLITATSGATAVWSANHKISGRAYVYVKLEFDSDVYPNGVPNISCVVKGKKCYDPRTTSFNANTDVSVANDTITLTAHGLSTFDIVKYDVNSGTAIGGLVDATTYYVIKVDVNTIKLATNYANCLAGTQINITSQPSSETQKFNFTTITTNPALQIRDYLTDTPYGLKADLAEINDTNIISVANTCDETVTLANPVGTENRFTSNGTFQVSQTPKTILENMLTTLGGFLIYSNGMFKIVPATYGTPTVTLSEQHFTSGININTRLSKKELFNAVKGLYSEPTNDYQPQDYPVLTNASYESEDNSERIYSEFDYPFTTSSRTCQRLSKIQLLKARQQITFSSTFTLEAFKLDIGDTVYITNSRMGWTNKTFEVSGWNFMIGGGDSSPALGISAEFRETASAVYDYTTSDYSTVSSGKATNLPSATTVSPPSAIALSDELVLYNDGTVIVKLVIELTAATDNFTEIYEVEIKQLTDADGDAVVDTYKLIGRGARTKFEFLNVIDKASYSVRARGVNIYGVNSTTITETHFVVGLIAPPSDVTNFAINVVGKDAHLTWDPIPDLDLSYYVVNFSNLLVNAEWQNSVTVVSKISRPATSVAVPAKKGTYMIKAVDKLGGASAIEATVVTNIDAIGHFNDITDDVQDPDFLGIPNNVSAYDTVKIYGGSRDLVLDTVEKMDTNTTQNFDAITDRNFDGGTVNKNVQPVGYYYFDAVVDVGIALTTRLSSEITQAVTDRDRLFDNVAITPANPTGLFDDEISGFDGDAPIKCHSDMQVALSDDAISYSYYRNFVVGDYTSRYYKFRLKLTSDNLGAVSIVSALAIKVEAEDRLISARDIESGTGTKSVSYGVTFKNIPALGIAVDNMETGDIYLITNKTTSGYDIIFKNSAGAGVDRTFDYLAKGY